jgi:hypothetical protein
LPELGRNLHHNVVLVLRLVDHRYLPLPKGVVQVIVDLAHGEPKPCGRGTVDGQISLDPRLLQIEMDIGQCR